MTVSEKKVSDTFMKYQIDCEQDTFSVQVDNKKIAVDKESIVISNDKMVLLNQQHGGHLYEYCKDQYKRQELWDFL